MEQLITTFLEQFHTQYYVCQTLTIVCLFVLGLFVCVGVLGKIDLETMLISYPVGLAAFVICSFVCLLVNIPYTPVFTTSLVFSLAVIINIAGIHKRKKKGIHLELLMGKKPAVIAFAASAVIIMALISTSGIISVSLSNDSMYYYNIYPRAIVFYGDLVRSFNVFLTDVGPFAAVLGTLPYLFGFNETFGIQTFFNINFILFFAYSVYKELGRGKADKLTVRLISLISVLFLSFSMPFIIASKWAMANVYFMEYFFICAYISREYSDEEEKPVIILAILFTMVSMVRMEGTIMVIFLLLCVSMLNYSNTQLSCAYLLPVMLLQLIYDIKIFFIMKIYAPYTFLTKEKAAVSLAALGIVFVYFLFIRGRVLTKIINNSTIGYIILIGLTAVNGVLFAFDRNLYIMNLKAFAGNLFHQSGWGSFPVSVIGIVILLAAMAVIDRAKIKIGYYDVLWIGFCLTTLAVCWARDGALQENVGDSGNRVLLQIVPLIVFSLTLKLEAAISRRN